VVLCTCWVGTDGPDYRIVLRFVAEPDRGNLLLSPVG